MDYDFITTCNWTATGTYTLRAFLGSSTDVVTTYYASIFYRKKGTSTWTALNSSGQMVVDSTGEWEVANNWNKSGNDCLTHSYAYITAINSCTSVEFNETNLGTNAGNFFLYDLFTSCSNLTSVNSFTIPDTITNIGNSFMTLAFAFCPSLTTMGAFHFSSNVTTIGGWFCQSCWSGCKLLTSMPVGFTASSKITSIGDAFLYQAWNGCTSLTSMPVGFNLPQDITISGTYAFLYETWKGCTSLTAMPVGFNFPSKITSTGSSFAKNCWMDCTSLASMPSGFNIPQDITTFGGDFMWFTWFNCTALKSDGYTEDIDFNYGATLSFGGTCPITPDSPTAGSSVAVNRLQPVSAFIPRTMWFN